MLFNSLQFFVFFIIVTGLYFLLPHKFRWLLLLISSCYFYMAFVPIYILILGFTIVIDYFAGILLENTTGSKRKLYLIASLVANIGVLAVFKYYNFFVDNANMAFKDLTSFKLPYLSILLPIGLSFHTFQAMSYTIEVYRGNQKAERHFGIYSLYVMFYPQLVAGPIERPQNLLHQFREKFDFDYERVTDGLKLMAWGLFKKVVIADRLATVVNSIYDKPAEHHGLSFVVATVFFAFQIFCDFSGYSDIAIGAAKVMGFTLMKNFNKPYHATSIQDFWGRWHISLSTWFKDYLYIPLGGSRVAVPRWYFNLFFVFLISGLWHGANWTFIVWGALNGFYLVFALITAGIRGKVQAASGLNKFPTLNRYIQTLITFALVTFAWIFFRAKSISVAWFIIKSSIIGSIADINAILHHTKLGDWGFTKFDFLMGICAIAFLEIVHHIQKKRDIIYQVKQWPRLMRWGFYFAFIFLLLMFGVTGSGQFIYFQF